MTPAPSDGLVFFGATGDLAYKKIFPALQAMARRGHFDVLVIGVARSAWTLDQFRARARESVTQHGGLDPAAFATLDPRLRYVNGDYGDASTYAAVRAALGDAKRSVYYLAIPPSLFATVIDGLRRAGATHDARVIIEKPFGRDLESARALNATLHAAFDESGCLHFPRCTRDAAGRADRLRSGGAESRAPSDGRRPRCLRAPAGRRDGRRCDALRARGRRRGGVAGRAADPRRPDAGARVRIGDVGAGGGRRSGGWHAPLAGGETP